MCFNQALFLPFIILLISLFSIEPVLLINITRQQEDKQTTPAIASDTEAYTNKYKNPLYGFQITIPKGYTGYGNSPRFSQHGITIPIINQAREEARIQIYAAYQNLNHPEPEDMAEVEIESIREYSQDPIVISKRRTSLNGVTALRLVVQYRLKENAEIYIKDFVLSTRKPSKNDVAGLGISYLVYLISAKDQYSRHRKIFQQMLKSWQMTSLSN
ncbi:MAG: hypothetical protein AB1489_13425 [Acidobacteriota bacterium]